MTELKLIDLSFHCSVNYITILLTMNEEKYILTRRHNWSDSTRI